MQRRLLLLANSRNHGQELFAHAAEAIKTFLADATGNEILFIPYALKDWDGYTASVAGAFASLGYNVEGIHERSNRPKAIREANIIFVGGGNTLRLLKCCQDFGLLAPIRERVRGAHYIGASAGTNLACPTVKTTNDMPIVQPRDFRALHLIPFQINVHFVEGALLPTHMGETRETRIREYHEENELPVLGLREGTWLRIVGDCCQLEGPSGAVLFRRDRPAEEVPPATDISHLLLT